MIEQTESRLIFRFGAVWQAVLKWDEHPAHVHGLRRLPGTHGVDFCALRGSDPYFIEVKNFCEYRIENKARLIGGDLAREVACKVRDTIASCVWSCGRERADDDLASFVRSFFAATRCRVVLWLEEDLVPRPPDRSALAEQIKRELRWLNPHVMVRHRGDPLKELVVVAAA